MARTGRNTGPWPLYFIPEKGTNPGQRGELKPGACWYAPWLLKPERGLAEGPEELSPKYRNEQMAIRPPLVIWLPGVACWAIDARASRARTWWDLVTPMNPGEDPATWVRRLTLAPSIDYKGYYHGYVQQGEVKPDVSGFAYDDEGYRVP